VSHGYTDSVLKDLYALIREAIQEELQVTAEYKGHLRELCPHAVGTKNGREQALFYQFGGWSESGLGPEGSSRNWRCLPLASLSNVSTQEGPWHTGQGHSRRHSCLDWIDVAW
jgi:hypothetical protein